MPMGAFDAMLSAGVGAQDNAAPDNPNLHMVGNREGADSYKQRALQLHQEMLELEKQYGNAAVIPRSVAARIHNVYTERERAINQWQELDNKAIAETNASDTAKMAFGNNSSAGALLGPDRPEGQFNKPIDQKMRERASGMQSKKPLAATPPPLSKAPAGPEGGAPPMDQIAPPQDGTFNQMLKKRQPQFGPSRAGAGQAF